MTTSQNGRTREFAQHMCEITPPSLPAEVVEHTKTVLYDVLGATLGATADRYPIRALLERVAAEVGGPPECQLVGSPLRTDCVTAALLNGTLAYYCDVESHHPSANVHAIAVVGPAAIAVAEKVQATGAELIAAVVAGVEATARVSYALSPAEQYARGFHPSSVAGALGATVAAGLLLGLDGDRLTHALGLAGNSASGLLSWVEDPTEQSRPFNIGIAAQHGVQAAVLANAGMPGAGDVFGGKYPFGEAFTGRWDGDALFAGSGERYEIQQLFFKRYTACVFIPAGVDGLLDVLASEDISPSDIEHVELRPPLSAYHVIDGNPLRSHCAQYVLAVAAHRDGVVTFDDIIEDRRSNSAIRDLSERIQLVGDAELDARSGTSRQSVGSKIVVLAKDGRRFEREVIHPRGAPENPLSREELDAKVRQLTDGVISTVELAELRATVDTLDELADVRELMRLLGASRQARDGVEVGA